MSKLNLLGDNLRNKGTYFNNSNSVKKSLYEVFGENSDIGIEYNKRISKFRAHYQERTFSNNAIKPQNILIDKIRDLLLKSNGIDEYKEGLYNLLDEVNKVNIKEQEKHKKIIYLKTQIAFADFISSNPDLFPPPIFSQEKYSKRMVNIPRCRGDEDCPKGMVCCEGYCRYPTASDMCPAWLGTMWCVAVAEPTPIGEGVSTVVTGIVAGYYILTRSECIAEYVKCTERNNAYENCSMCLQYCIVQGHWCI